ncbi:MAG TPA: hypothetical protein DCS07_09985 [Bdellovibrionales bacterium]|nr:MAG: hypothetical protein A2Z97_04430 [Bdellovibrionales bacterium GWB1_52_6]OFZ02725.1 MAG: hypothetical protein A2X97_12345 [Bdellovibrionales bacterium GWA1_52_35]OFZ39745.1 MAG: hypothetical protein A2070_00955 [Bdellovibrionales bacterium GWC1_52_8]HAR42941.1 hypothetical protein [Bdellovibrionales bacterium]HCM41624.1 hypothetical protein [Bdellovibrionales bacterium]
MSLDKLIQIAVVLAVTAVSTGQLSLILREDQRRSPIPSRNRTLRISATRIYFWREALVAS